MIEINISWTLLIVLIGIIVFLIHNGFSTKLFIKKDEHIADKFFDKFPLVAPEFMNKNLKEQNIENNQEIHEINKRLDKIEFQLSRLNLQQSMTLDEVKSKK